MDPVVRLTAREGRLFVVAEQAIPEDVVKRSHVLQDFLSVHGDSAVVPMTWPAVQTWIAQASAPRVQTRNAARDRRSWDNVVSNLQVYAFM